MIASSMENILRRDIFRKLLQIPGLVNSLRSFLHAWTAESSSKKDTNKWRFASNAKTKRLTCSLKNSLNITKTKFNSIKFSLNVKVAKAHLSGIFFVKTETVQSFTKESKLENLLKGHKMKSIDSDFELCAYFSLII